MLQFLCNNAAVVTDGIPKHPITLHLMWGHGSESHTSGNVEHFWRTGAIRKDVVCIIAFIV